MGKFSDYVEAMPSYDTLEERAMDLDQPNRVGRPLAAQSAQGATQVAQTAQNAPAASPKRPRPIVCIADGCVCSFLDDEQFETLKREDKPIGCATL
jgi:hypothetical protein